MLMTVKLSEDLVMKARQYGATQHRSAPKQIEHWARIGRAVEDNPDLPYDFIQEIFLAKEEGGATPYVFGKDD